jgi:hypothetical protein
MPADSGMGGINTSHREIPKHILKPDEGKIQQLLVGLGALPVNRWTVEQAQTYARELYRLYWRQARMAIQISRLRHRINQISYRVTLTDRLVHQGSLDALLKMLLNRRNSTGANLYAAALGRRGSALRRLANPAAMVEAGRRGAQIRWSRARAAQAAAHSNDEQAQAALTT